VDAKRTGAKETVNGFPAGYKLQKEE